MKEQVTVLVDKKDMKTILMAVRKRRGSKSVDFIIDNRKKKWDFYEKDKQFIKLNKLYKFLNLIYV